MLGLKLIHVRKRGAGICFEYDAIHPLKSKMVLQNPELDNHVMAYKKNVNDWVFYF